MLEDKGNKSHTNKDHKSSSLSLPWHHQSQNFCTKFSKIDRKQGLIKRIDDYERICSVIAPLYWIVSFASGYIEERGGNKYLIFDNSFAENKDLLKKYTEFWDVVKRK